MNPIVGSTYTILTGGGSNETKFGGVGDTSGFGIKWVQAVTKTKLTITVPAKVSATTSLVSNFNPSFAGQAVTFTATVTSPSLESPPTGTVTFYDGTTVLQTVALSQGVANTQAAFTTSGLSVGSHVITAVYSGDTNYEAGTAALTETVQQASTSTSLGASSSSTAYGQAVTFTAQILSSSPNLTPTGTVSFYDNGVLLAVVTLDADLMGYHAAFTSSSLSLDCVSSSPPVGRRIREGEAPAEPRDRAVGGRGDRLLTCLRLGRSLALPSRAANSRNSYLA